MEALFDFIESQCKKYKIDESHGLKHAKGTLVKASEILKTLQGVTSDERRMALYASAIHDMCDTKYTDVKEASEDIRLFLTGEENWSMNDANSLIAIVTTMSYSKLKMAAAGGPPTYPDHGIWQRAYHVARNADLLEGYIVARCALYNKQIHPDYTEEQHWNRVEELFEKRVFMYKEDGWIILPGAIMLIYDLEVEARRCLKDRSLAWAEPSLDQLKSIFRDMPKLKKN